MTKVNAEIIRDMPNVAKLAAEAKRKRAEGYKLLHEADRLDLRSDNASMVSEVFEGMALNVQQDQTKYGRSTKVFAVDPNAERYAEVYRNVQEKDPKARKAFNARLCLYPVNHVHPRDHLVWHLSEKDAIEVAKRWVTKGKMPKEKC